ncbi:MAG: MFS transporter, partial [Methanomassiliicoccales archaeon]
GRIAPVEERGKYMGFYLGMLLFGTVSGPALGGVIAETFYINTPFFFYAGFALFSFLLLLFGVKGDLVESLSKAESDVRLSSLKPLLKDYSFLAINVAIFTIFVIRIGVINTLVPVFAVFNLGLTEGTVGLVLTVSALLNFVTMLLVGPLTDRYGRGHFMVSSLMLTGLFTLMIPLSVDMISFTLLLAAIGLALGLTGPIMAWVTDITRSEQLGSAMGIFRTMSDAGFVAGPVMVTVIAGPTDQPLGYPPFLLAAVLIAVASLLLMRARDPVRQARGENR